DPQGKVVGLTNVHVVCPSDSRATNLKAKATKLTDVEFTLNDDGTTVTPGTLVLLEIHAVPEPSDLLYSAFYTAGATGTTESIAQGLVDEVTDAPNGVTVSISPDDDSTIVLTGPATLDCNVYGPPPKRDSTVSLYAAVKKANATTNKIKFSGSVATENLG